MSHSAFKMIQKIFSVVGIALALSALTTSSASAQCRRCIDCNEGGVIGHKIGGTTSGPGLTAGTAHTTCEAPTCQTCFDDGGCHEHTTCNMTAFAVKDARAAVNAVRTKNVVQVAKLLRSSKGRLVVNERRNALQAVGCDGIVVAHIPLSPAMLAAVKRERQVTMARVARI